MEKSTLNAEERVIFWDISHCTFTWVEVVAERKTLLKGVRKRTETAQRHEDVYCIASQGFGDNLDPHTLADVGQIPDEDWIHSVGNQLVDTLWLSSFVTKTARLEKFVHVTPLLDSVPVPRCSRKHVFTSIMKCFTSATWFGKQQA